MQMQYCSEITDYLVQISDDVRGDLERAEEGEEDAEEDIETADDEGGHDWCSGHPDPAHWAALY